MYYFQVKLVFQVDDHNIISDGMLKMFCMEYRKKAYEIIVWWHLLVVYVLFI